jgi:4a-hydroxytetrahydrobiopterin dehydratase
VTADLTPSQFSAAEGAEDWRVLFSGANAHFRTGSYEAAVGLVAEIGRLATAAAHRPDVDLRPAGVFVQLRTPEARWGLSERDLELARSISAAARGAGAEADPSAVQYAQLTIDVLAVPPVMAFWRAILGYDEAAVAAGGRVIFDKHAPTWWTLADPEGNEVDVATWQGRE